jgi:sirohydrochlorin ferrochelatase
MAVSQSPPRLLLVAHGTRSAAGSATTAAFAAAVARQRPDVTVQLSYLDVAEPTLAAALAAPGPTVVVPLLLSTGHHVTVDIPAATAGRPGTLVAAHFGPARQVVDAVADRLHEARAGAGRTAGRTCLVAAGSRHPGAASEYAVVAAALSDRLGRAVTVHTMADDLPAVLGGDCEVATYLLAPGQFSQTLAAAATHAVIAEPLGVHPALVDLVWLRYAEARD